MWYRHSRSPPAAPLCGKQAAIGRVSQLTQENSAAVLGVVGDNSGTKFQNMARGGGCVVLSSQMGKHSVSEAVAWGARADGKTVGEGPGLKLAQQARFTKYDAYVPLQFWFCRNPGLALPLIALQYHEVRIILQINTDFVCGPQYNGSNCQPSACIQDNSLFADYIYLDTDERRRFAQVSHEYLIEQIQHQNFRSNGGSLDLNFNHPVKELIWTGGQSSVTGLFGILPGAYGDAASLPRSFLFGLSAAQRRVFRMDGDQYVCDDGSGCRRRGGFQL